MVREYSTPPFFYKNRITMSTDSKILRYTLDEKTYQSLQIQFQREYVYNMVLSKLLKELNKN